MKWAFAGTPVFAARILSALLEKGYRPEGVFTQPDRPSGRGMKLTPSPVKVQALQAQLPVFQPERLKHATDTMEWMKAADLDVFIVVAYGLIIPSDMLALPRWGCWNIHASLLPRWRGAAPIHRAIQYGDAETGVDIMQMEAGLDTGAIHTERRTPIYATDTTATLHDRLIELGIEALLETLDKAQQGQLPPPREQSTEGICYAEKIRSEEARLEWSLSVEVLERQIRAFYPVPGAWTLQGEERVKISKAFPLEGETSSDPIGTVNPYMVAGQLVPAVVCGEGRLLGLQTVQRAGSQAVAADIWWKHQHSPVRFS